MTKDGNVQVVGEIVEEHQFGWESITLSKGWIVKADLDGNTIWEVRDTAYWDIVEDGTPRSTCGLTSCVELESGNVIAVGHSERRIFTPDLFEGWMIKITPDGCVDTLCNMTTVIEEALEKEKEIKIYPNPASDFIHVLIRPEQIYDAEVRLIDLSGKVISSFSQLYFGATMMIPTHDLPSGLYVVQLVTEEGVLQVEKVVVR